MNTWEFAAYLLIIAGSTYLIRAVPFAAVKKQIHNRLIRSFLYYIPYAVLTAMTLPAVFYATDDVRSAFVGFVTAVLFAARKKGLTTVAVAACVAVFLAEFVLEGLAML